MKTKNELLEKLSECVLEMEDEDIEEVAREYIQCGYEPQDGLLFGLVEGMKRASELYEEGEYFVPELIACSDAMYAGINILQKAMPENDKVNIGKIVIAVIEGDTHDIGKNLVKIMLETGGFEVCDLGRDVPVDTIVNYVENNDVDILCMSSLMTTTMSGMASVIEKLKELKIRDKVKIMVGGAPVSSAFAKKIGADGYTKNAIEAVAFAKKLVGVFE